MASGDTKARRPRSGLKAALRRVALLLPCFPISEFGLKRWAILTLSIEDTNAEFPKGITASLHTSHAERRVREPGLQAKR